MINEQKVFGINFLLKVKVKVKYALFDIFNVFRVIASGATP